MAKSVYITFKFSESFVRMLSVKCTMQGWQKWLSGAEEPPRLDPAGVLSMLALGEARGGISNVIDMATPVEWRGEIEVVHEARQVKDE